ncbi:hypothetical protein EAH72_33365 [Pseudomonas caspiana]|nr:hypothetical protein EAH72_33365 [Pseudomonas caspiana]
MVNHYSTGGSDVACGRNNQNLCCTTDSSRVTCKSCQRSLAKLAPATTPADGKSASAKQALNKQNNVNAFCFMACWRAHLEALPNRCRLPRGSRPQIFV